MMRSSDPLDLRAVLGSGRATREVSATAGLDGPCARRVDDVQAETKERPRHEQRNYAK